MSLQSTLHDGLQALGFGAEQIRNLEPKLLQFLALLEQWNQAYNLTAIRDPHDMLVKHVFDSLALWPHVHAQRLIDVGSGAGLPGIPLALAGACESALLVDSAGKKMRFVNHAAAELGLTQVRGWHGRIEALPADQGGDVIVSRAFASLADFCALSGHALRPGGRLLAMKANLSDAELSALPAPFVVKAVHELSVPGLNAARCVVHIEKEGPP